LAWLAGVFCTEPRIFKIFGLASWDSQISEIFGLAAGVFCTDAKISEIFGPAVGVFCTEPRIFKIFGLASWDLYSDSQPQKILRKKGLEI
jgi:hypothetical protein